MKHFISLFLLILSTSIYAQVVIHTHNVKDAKIFIESLKTGAHYTAEESALFIFTVTDKVLEKEPGGNFYTGILTGDSNKIYCQDANTKERFRFEYTPPSLTTISKSNVYIHMNQGKELSCTSIKLKG